MTPGQALVFYDGEYVAGGGYDHQKMIIPAEIFVYIRLESQNRSFVRQPYDRVQKQAHLFSKELGLLHLTAVFCPKER